MPTNIQLHAAADKAIAQQHDLKRSEFWDDVQNAFLKTHPTCAVCDESKQLNVHHMFPFHFVVLAGRPDLELDSRNLVTLCVNHERQHHLLLGHLDDFESYNPDVLPFIKKYAGLTSAAIKADPAFKKAKAKKPKHVGDMTMTEMTAFKRMLDKKFKPVAALVAKAKKGRP